MMFFSQNKLGFNSIFKILFIILITTVFFFLIFFEIKDEIAPDMTSICGRAQMIHKGQELNSALQVMGQPDTIEYHTSFVDLKKVDIYTYKLSGLSAGPVIMFIREGKVVTILRCK